MLEILAWFLSVNWWEVVKDVAIPVIAILVPTYIAVRLARTERLAADRGRYLDSRRNAAEGVIHALAHMVSLDPSTEQVQDKLRNLRGSIAVYRTVLVGEDVFSGDWLGMKHHEGMKLWVEAEEAVRPLSGSSRVSDIYLKLERLRPAHDWANTTLETLSGWLSGHVDGDVLRREGAALLPDHPFGREK